MSITPRHVEVRMRRASECSSRPFTSWPIDDLDRLTAELGRWSNPDVMDVTGQFNDDDLGQWFFELVAHDND